MGSWGFGLNQYRNIQRMQSNEDDIELTDPSTQPYQYQIFVNNCNDYIGSQIVQTLRNDHLIQVNPNIITGSVNPSDRSSPPDDIHLLTFSDKTKYNTALLTSDIVVFDLTLQNLQQFEYVLKVLKYMRLQKEKVLVCVSQLLSWNLTEKKKIKQEDIETRNTTYQYLKELENMCLDIQNVNDKVRGYVVGTGIVYGMGERQLLPLFKQAILQNPDELTIIAEGKNFIPMIHVTDLCQVVEEIVFNKPNKKYYLLSDQSETTQYQLIKTIADSVGNGKIKLVPKEEALWDSNYHLMTLDLQIQDKTSIKSWVSKEGFAKNITQIVAEFNLYRGIKANKIFVSGMPLAGKSYTATVLAKNYSLPQILIKQTVEMAKMQPGAFGQQILKALQAIKAKMVEQQQKIFDEAKKKKKAKKGQPVEQFNPDKCIPRLPDNLLVKVYQWRLSQPDCQNKGYVLDGWPKSYEQANQLFIKDGTVNTSILPNACFFIESSEEEVKDRLKKLPVETTQGTHWTEEATNRRLQLHKKNTEGKPLIKFFEENNVDCKSIPLNWTNNADLIQFVERNGPIGFSPVQVHPYQEQAKVQEPPKPQVEQKKPEQQKQPAQQGFNIDLLKANEKKLLDQKSKPIRQYLIDNVIPHLTQGLIEVCRQMPKQPLDFLIKLLESKQHRKSPHKSS